MRAPSTLKIPAGKRMAAVWTAIGAQRRHFGVLLEAGIVLYNR